MLSYKLKYLEIGMKSSTKRKLKKNKDRSFSLVKYQKHYDSNTNKSKIQVPDKKGED